MVQKFKTIPLVIEAVQWDGNNFDEIVEFTNGLVTYHTWQQYNETGVNKQLLHIPNTPMLAGKGDWVIKDAMGKIHFYRLEAFARTYELAETQSPPPNVEVSDVLQFVMWRDSLRKEVRCGTIVYDIPKYYKFLEEKELLDYFLKVERFMHRPIIKQ